MELEDEGGRPLSVGSVLGGLDPSEILRAADEIRALEEHPGWRFLEALTEQHLRKAVDRMTDGQLRGIEAYAHSAGFVKGLRSVRDLRAHVLRTAVEVAAAERIREDPGA